VVDVAGPDGLLLPLAGALAWLAWGWGTLGLAATAAAALPGALGTIAGAVQRTVLPGAARRAAAVLIGVGIGVVGTSAATASSPAADSAGTPDAPPALDWAGPDVPDWPAAAPAEGHVVVSGDCLWTVAAGRLTTAGAPPAGDAEIAAAVRAWWSRNAGVIGPNPDLLLPGQVLQPPEPP
jgi:nucleoid-associated protein YgaU